MLEYLHEVLGIHVVIGDPAPKLVLVSEDQDSAAVDLMTKIGDALGLNPFIISKTGPADAWGACAIIFDGSNQGAVGSSFHTFKAQELLGSGAEVNQRKRLLWGQLKSWVQSQSTH